jgi:DNA-binding IclR family transcriptional regulator
MPRAVPIGPTGSREKRLSLKEDALSEKPSNTLQTLHRGLQALSIISTHEGGISVAELAARLDVHRAIAYRLAATLELHGLVTRSPDGQLRLGVGILTLAERYSPQLRILARPVLRRLAEQTRATAFLSVAEGDECVAILVCEPEDTVLRVAYRVGSRHSLKSGAAGIAILSARPPRDGEAEAVAQARRDGYSLTRGHLQKGAVGVASPIRRLADRSTGIEASVGVVALDDLDVETATKAVTVCAQELAEAIGLS